MTMLWVCLAGGLGAVARFLLDSRINSRFSVPVPLGTLVINVMGSLLLGLITAAALNHLGFSQNLKEPLGTGFCGGFTTFSTASVETARAAYGCGRRVGALHCNGNGDCGSTGSDPGTSPGITGISRRCPRGESNPYARKDSAF